MSGSGRKKREMTPLSNEERAIVRDARIHFVDYMNAHPLTRYYAKGEAASGEDDAHRQDGIKSTLEKFMPMIEEHPKLSVEYVKISLANKYKEWKREQVEQMQLPPGLQELHDEEEDAGPAPRRRPGHGVPVPTPVQPKEIPKTSTLASKPEASVMIDVGTVLNQSPKEVSFKAEYEDVVLPFNVWSTVRISTLIEKLGGALGEDKGDDNGKRMLALVAPSGRNILLDPNDSVGDVIMTGQRIRLLDNVNSVMLDENKLSERESELLKTAISHTPFVAPSLEESSVGEVDENTSEDEQDNTFFDDEGDGDNSWSDGISTRKRNVAEIMAGISADVRAMLDSMPNPKEIEAQIDSIDWSNCEPREAHVYDILGVLSSDKPNSNSKYGQSQIARTVGVCTFFGRLESPSCTCAGSLAEMVMGRTASEEDSVVFRECNWCFVEGWQIVSSDTLVMLGTDKGKPSLLGSVCTCLVLELLRRENAVEAFSLSHVVEEEVMELAKACQAFSKEHRNEPQRQFLRSFCDMISQFAEGHVPENERKRAVHIVPVDLETYGNEGQDFGVTIWPSQYHCFPLMSEGVTVYLMLASGGGSKTAGSLDSMTFCVGVPPNSLDLKNMLSRIYSSCENDMDVDKAGRCPPYVLPDSEHLQLTANMMEVNRNDILAANSYVRMCMRDAMTSDGISFYHTHFMHYPAALLKGEESMWDPKIPFLGTYELFQAGGDTTQNREGNESKDVEGFVGATARADRMYPLGWIELTSSGTPAFAYLPCRALSLDRRLNLDGYAPDKFDRDASSGLGIGWGYEGEHKGNDEGDTSGVGDADIFLQWGLDVENVGLLKAVVSQLVGSLRRARHREVRVHVVLPSADGANVNQIKQMASSSIDNDNVESSFSVPRRPIECIRVKGEKPVFEYRGFLIWKLTLRHHSRK